MTVKVQNLNFLSLFFFSFVKDFHQNVQYESHKFELLNLFFPAVWKIFIRMYSMKNIFVIHAGPEDMFSVCVCTFFSREILQAGHERSTVKVVSRQKEVVTRSQVKVLFAVLSTQQQQNKMFAEGWEKINLKGRN